MANYFRNAAAMEVVSRELSVMPLTQAEIELAYDSLAGQYQMSCRETVGSSESSNMRFTQAVDGFFSQGSWTVGSMGAVSSMRFANEFSQYLGFGSNCPDGAPANRVPRIVSGLVAFKKDMVRTATLAGWEWQLFLDTMGYSGRTESLVFINRITGTVGKLERAVIKGRADEAQMTSLEELIILLKNLNTQEEGYKILGRLGELGYYRVSRQEIVERLRPLLEEPKPTPTGGEVSGMLSSGEAPSGSPGPARGGGASGRMTSAQYQAMWRMFMARPAFGPFNYRPMLPSAAQPI